MALPLCLSAVGCSSSKGLANGVGRPMLSLRDLLLPFMKSILAGRLIACRMELALRLRAWPDVIYLDRDAAVGAAKLEERLALRVGGADEDLVFIWWGLEDGRTLLKYACLAALVGVLGEVTGVVEAIVPPKPVLKLGETTFRFVVIGPVVTDIGGGGAMRAGLWGEPIAITKGTLEFDEVLGLREGGEAMALELVEPSRDRNCNGAGTAESMIGLLGLLLS